jgi:hypothetical protein
VGSGGASFTAFKSILPTSEERIANTYGVLKMTLHPEGYDWEFVTAPSGAVADSGSGQCNGAQPPPPTDPTDTTAPAVQKPQQVLPYGGWLGATTAGKIPIKLSWSATDDKSGVASYELQQSVNGGAFTQASLPSDTSTERRRRLEPGSTNQFRVRATDGAGNTSNWATGPAFVVDAYQEDSDAIVYAGSWTQQALSLAYGGGLKYSGAGGSAAQFTFTGRDVAWVSPRGPDMGKATVSVDGVVVKTVDLYSPTTEASRIVFNQSNLDPAESHTITVQVLGTKSTESVGTQVAVDAFVVLR